MEGDFVGFGRVMDGRWGIFKENWGEDMDKRFLWGWGLDFWGRWNSDKLVV